jgi:protein-L-isoaspartate O-methyltransferase
MIARDGFLHKLHELYSDRSKHSVYQNIPLFARDALGYTETINERWRGDSSRWEYMQHYLDFSNQSVLDVGANTGFFTLSLAHKYPDSVFTALEGNVNHAEFIRLVATQLGMTNVRVISGYLDLAALDSLAKYDTILLYNVLHHAGADFDKDLVPSRDDLFGYLVKFATMLRGHCARSAFQMGYNWCGNKQQPVVALRDDAGKCLYTCRFLRQAGWVIEAIAIPRHRKGAIPVSHENLPEDVIVAANACDEMTLRNRLSELLDPYVDTFSEFYRRPVFVCR